MNDSDLALREMTSLMILILTTEGLTISGAKDIAKRGLKDIVTAECIKDAIATMDDNNIARDVWYLDTHRGLF
ncbi:MAG: hypothetical protein GQ570_11810 [Helicobacteraceae bacterium]|nr:hypothetical protein [Helicobacteraceae bacterium]